MLPSTPASVTGRRRRSSPSVSVVIPVRETGGLPLVLRALPPVAEVIVVADPAAGAEVAAVRTVHPDARVLRPVRDGVGAALATGVAAATGDVVVTLNGDGSTDPGEIPRYVAALVGGADVALGSRYAAGGRDLTGGRFRRWADRLLIFFVNALLGTRRTDPGFGYAAFWRDTVGRLDLPAVAPGAVAGWGDGPEIGPLLTLRPAGRGLVVAEVGSVAYPRMRRSRRSDRARLRHWLTAVVRERRDRPGGRHATPPAAAAAGPAPAAVVVVPGPDGPAWPRADRKPAEPIWSPARRRSAPAPWWATGHSAASWSAAESSGEAARRRLGTASGGEQPNDRPPPLPAGHPERASGPDVRPRPAWDHPTAATLPLKPRREVGSRRRRLEGYRQRPELRVINGEGAGGKGRGGRLWAVPRNKKGS